MAGGGTALFGNFVGHASPQKWGEPRESIGIITSRESRRYEYIRTATEADELGRVARHRPRRSAGRHASRHPH